MQIGDMIYEVRFNGSIIQVIPTIVDSIENDIMKLILPDEMNVLPTHTESVKVGTDQLGKLVIHRSDYAVYITSIGEDTIKDALGLISAEIDTDIEGYKKACEIRLLELQNQAHTVSDSVDIESLIGEMDKYELYRNRNNKVTATDI